MKATTRNDLRDGATGLVTLVLIGAILILSTGCAVRHAGHKHGIAKAPKGFGKMWKPGRRCKPLGKVVTKNVAVMVERNCLRNGVTTVGILVLNTANKGKLAASDAAQGVVSVLGFRPTLATVFVGKIKKSVFILSVVTGTNYVRPPGVTGEK